VIETKRTSSYAPYSESHFDYHGDVVVVGEIFYGPGSGNVFVGSASVNDGREDAASETESKSEGESESESESGNERYFAPSAGELLETEIAPFEPATASDKVRGNDSAIVSEATC
jgi:hypothetical protein